LIRWTTSAQSSRLNAVAVFVTEYWTYTVGEPADSLPLTRTIACGASSPDDFALKVSSVFWFGERVQFALRERIPSRLREPLVGFFAHCGSPLVRAGVGVERRPVPLLRVPDGISQGCG
jgi:hypothetical protein